MEKIILRTDIPIPRNYGLTTENGAVHFFTPAAHLLGGFQLLGPQEKRMLVNTYRQYKKEQLHSWRNGEKWKTKAPAFQLGKYEERILKNRDLFKLLEDRIQKEDGTMALTRSGGSTAIRNFHLYNERAIAEVKSSTSRTITGGTEAYHKVMLSGLELTDSDIIKYKEAVCPCGEGIM